MKKRIAVPPARLEAYAGRYKAPDGQIVTIVRKDDHLVWSVADSPSFNAFATGERHFYTTAFETDFVFDFERELDPHPRRVVFYQPGQPQPELADRMAD